MSVWTEEEAKRAAAMWAAGQSARAIGVAFGITRNAAMGRLHRMGAKTPRYQGQRCVGDDGGPQAPERTPYQRPRTFKAKPDFEPPAPEPGTDSAFTTLDLQPGQCKWPITQDAPFMHCGQPIAEGSPYCPFHRRKAHGPGTHSERAAA